MSDVSSKRYRPTLYAVRAVFVTVGVYFAGQTSALAGVLVLGALIPSMQLDSPYVISMLYLLSSTMMFLGLLAVMKLTKVTFHAIKLKKPQWADLGYALIGFGVYFMLVQITFGAIKLLFPSAPLNQAQDIGISNVTGAGLVLVFGAVVIAPVLVEELMFRGYLYSRLRSTKLSYIVSSLIVSVLFGLAHRQLNISIDTFILSMVMIYVLRERDSLWATIGMHFIKNSFAFLAVFVLKLR